jgi:hypothetical protein
MMGLGVEVEIGMCGLEVHFVYQTAIRLPESVCVQEGEVSFTFGFHGERIAWADAV